MTFDRIQNLTSLNVLATLSQNDKTQLLVAVDPKTEKEFVLKIGLAKSLKPEVDCQGALKKHPNIIELFAHFRHNEFMILQFEKAPGCCLTSYLLQNPNMDLERVCEIFEQLVSALEHLHSNGWVHRDLKPDNVIFDESTNRIKLIDFEYSSAWSTETLLSQSLGTFEYSAPELRYGSSYRGPDVDLWSLGVTMFVIMFVPFPFSRKQLSTFTESVGELFTPQMSETNSVSQILTSILSSLMEVDSSKRIPLGQIKNILIILSGKQENSVKSTSSCSSLPTRSSSSSCSSVDSTTSFKTSGREKKVEKDLKWKGINLFLRFFFLDKKMNAATKR